MRLRRLFQRYAQQHGHIEHPGFSLTNWDGESFGHIDKVELSHGRVIVSGWATAENVGLTSGRKRVAKAPNLIRSDVTSAPDYATPGFVLDLPNHMAPMTFWADIDGVPHAYALPVFQHRLLRLMKVRLLLPFCLAVGRAIPWVALWALTSRPGFRARAKKCLGLSPQHGALMLDPKLFSDEGNRPDVAHHAGVTIVLPVYNALDVLQDCLDRVLRHTDLSWRLIVVEDASSDPMVRPWLRNWHGSLPDDLRCRVTVLENSENMGFIGSVNRGLSHARTFDDHIVLLNSDALVPEKWASRLLRPMLEQDDIATVTPLSNDAEIFSAPEICEADQLAPGEADALDAVAMTFAQTASVADAPTGVGFCMAMNIDYVNKIPTLDTAFGRGYGEEVDWCQKALLKGGRHVGQAGLFVEHRGGASFGSAQKQALIIKNNALISKRYPHYDADVQSHISEDPHATARLALGLALAAQRATAPIPVFIAHALGGGAERYLKDRITSEYETHPATVVLRVGGSTDWRIELHRESGVIAGLTNSEGLLERMLALIPNKRVIYSCAVGARNPLAIPPLLARLSQGPDDQLEVLFHDYFPISPSYTLVNSDGAFHGVPPSDTQDKAHTLSIAGTRYSLTDWQAEWYPALERADQLVTFSQNSRAIVTTAYPSLGQRVTVQPHQIGQDVRPVTATAPNTPTIGILGNISAHKGAAVLAALSEELSPTSARMVLLGNLDPAFRVTSDTVIHGDYDPCDIAALAAHYGIDRWFIPSIWPETFSYTTHEAIATGLPVWCFDVGAQADAVRANQVITGHGGVIPLPTEAINAKSILAQLLNEEETACQTSPLKSVG